MGRSVKIKELHLAYASLPLVRAALDFFASRRRVSKVTTLNTLLDVLQAAGLRATPLDILDVFKELEDAGCGRLIAPSRGSPACFRWDVNLVSVGRVAAGRGGHVLPLDGSGDEYDAETDDEDDEESDEMEEEQDVGEDQGEGESIEYRFMLRPDYEVRVSLPRDFTQTEAARFARFLQMLPFEEPLGS